ncbi:small redox-active disulfide protein 2 [Dehalogenimonas formicexedens]|uniref:Small redox-active disulfide protein 2 n=1 Tax=Dehalogenimonas formicexedens TaxID=1839801 RepID=A0A1P8F8L8_9CHLR|nr:thioredoxin family protein [Dehalogenimonas formicexedens]APV44821.1 small redox-active disulfide protein 2 [Dehalogenimonas formicexedens]
MQIKILGTGCAKCKTLEAVTREAVNELGVDAEITKVSELQDIMTYPITMTPGLVVNEKVIVSGRVPDKKELIRLLKANRV